MIGCVRVYIHLSLLIVILVAAPTLAYGTIGSYLNGYFQSNPYSDPLRQTNTIFLNAYHDGLLDGEKSARDATDACGGYNSTATNNECVHEYDLGLKKGCEISGDKLPFDPSPEYGQCRQK